MPAARSILYIKIASFFSTVEQLNRADIAPMVVVRERQKATGVVVCASREARECGVEDGLTVRRAQRACPDAVIVKADYALYRQFADAIYDVLAQYSPQVEPEILGAAYVDVTGSRALFGEADHIAGCIASEIYKNLRLKVSIGCAGNKLIARIAAGSGTWFARVPTGREQAFLADLPVNILPAVRGARGTVENRLRELGVRKIGQLAEIPPELLVRQFGRVGHSIAASARGIDSVQVKAEYPRDTIIIEHMCDNEIEEPAVVEEAVEQMALRAQAELRRRNALAGEVMLKLYDRETCIPAYFRFKKPVDSSESILQPLAKLLHEKMQPGMGVSRVQVTLSDLAPGEAVQLSLFNPDERKMRIGRTIELISERFGDGSIFAASSLDRAGRAEVVTRIAA